MPAVDDLYVVLRANVANFSEGMERARGSAARFDQSMGAGMLGLGRFGTLAPLALGAAGIAAVKFASDFQASMERIHTQAGASQQEVNRLTQSVLNMAGKVGVGPNELAQGLYHIESAGFRGAQALDMLKASAEGARIGNANLEDVTQAMIAAMASGIKGVHGANDAMALLNTTVGVGDMRMQGLAKAFATGILPSARSAGLSIVDVSAALATITDNATPADEAATRLRMTFALMSAPTLKAVGALASIGMSSTQLASDMRKPDGLLVAVDDLKSHLEASGKTAVEQNQVIEHAFGGGRTSGAILTLIEESDRLRLKYQQLGDSASRAQAFQESWNATSQTFAQRMHVVEAAAQALAIRLGQDLIAGLERTATFMLNVAAATERTVGWFERHRAVTLALAGAITGMLLPAAATLAVTLAESGYLRALYAVDALRGGVVKLATAFSGAGLASKAMMLAGGLAFAGIGLGVAYALDQQRKFNEEVAKTRDALAAAFTPSADESLQQLSADLQQARQASVDFLQNIQGHGSQAMAQIEGAAQALQRIQTQYQATSDNVRRYASANHLATSDVMALARANQIDLTGSYGTVADALTKAISATEADRTTTGQLADAHRVLASAIQSADDKLKALKTEFDILVGSNVAVNEALIQFRDGVRKLSLELAHGAVTFSLNTQAGRDNASAIDNLIGAAEAHREAVFKQTGSLTASTAAFQTNLAYLLAHTRMTAAGRQAVIAYFESIGLVPKDWSTVFHTNAPQAKAQVDALLGSLLGIEARQQIFITAHVDTGAADQALQRLSREQAGLGATPAHNAAGGMARGWSWVGERGPELAYFGGGGARIYPHDQSVDMAGGAMTATVPVTVVVDGRAVTQSVQTVKLQRDRRNGRDTFRAG